MGDITPAADPNMVSDSQRIMQTQALLMAAKENPGMYNVYEVNKKYLESLRIQDIEAVLPDPKGPNAIPGQPHYKVQEAQVKAQAMLQGKQIEAKTMADKLQLEIAKLMQQEDVTRAEIAKIEAETLYLLEQSDGVGTGHQIAMMEMQLGNAKLQHEGIKTSLGFVKDLQRHALEEKKVGVQPAKE